MIIDHKKIKLPVNYVAILPDPDFEFYHKSDGTQSSIRVATSLRQYKNPHSEWDYEEEEVVESIGHNLSYSGKVIQIPEKLIFNGYLAEKFFEDNRDVLGGFMEQDVTDERSMEKRKASMRASQKLQEIREDSMEYDVPIEVEVGDRVFYDFTEKFDPTYIETDIGELLLVPYDKLEVRVRGAEVYPLNDNVLIEWIKKDKLKLGNLELHAPTKEIYESKGIQEAKVVALPVQSQGNINPKEHVDISGLNIGDIIGFIPQYAFYLENENHYVLFGGKEILRIKAKDILYKKICDEV